jgi:hypothetical protein
MNTTFKDIIINDDKRALIEKVFLTKLNTITLSSLKNSNQLFIEK